MTKDQIAEILYNAAENCWHLALEEQPHPISAQRPRRTFEQLTPKEIEFYRAQAEALLQRAEVRQR